MEILFLTPDNNSQVELYHAVIITLLRKIFSDVVWCVPLTVSALSDQQFILAVKRSDVRG